MHRICVISDDLYYLIGFREAISDKIDTFLFSNMEVCLERMNENKDSLFIISINALDDVRALVDEISGKGIKTIMVYDIPCGRVYSHARFLSKRDTAEHIVRFLISVLFGPGKKLNTITARQASIIRRLATGQRQFFIAGDDHRSIKTISGIKKNITDKIGLKTMNDLSLLLADIIIRVSRNENNTEGHLYQWRE